MYDQQGTPNIFLPVCGGTSEFNPENIVRVGFEIEYKLFETHPT
jgi:hypothetical protein